MSDSGQRTIVSKAEEIEPGISGVEQPSSKDGPLSFPHNGKIGRDHGTKKYRARKRSQMRAARVRSEEAKTHRETNHESSDTAMHSQFHLPLLFEKRTLALPVVGGEGKLWTAGCTTVVPLA